MTISLSSLRDASRRTSRPAVRTLAEARSLRSKTVFLCHSHHDTDLVRGLVTLFNEAGWLAYVDWSDSAMPDQPDRETANRLKAKIVELDFFFFLATPNSMSSRWCPWEIGYADGKKALETIVVCPTTDAGTTHGSEYLALYRRLDVSTAQSLAVWRPGVTTGGVLVADL